MATPGYFDRVPAVGNKPTAIGSSSPHTPTRQITSPLSSPLVGHRVDEESVIFEIGARHFSAGFTGESSPRCRLSFGPEASKRVGDYRTWLPSYKQRPRIRRSLDSWGDDHELWQMDMRDVDLALVGDKIERAVREAYNQYLLLDCKSTKKLIVVLPSALPHPLLNTILWSLFQISPSPPTITLFPCDMLAGVAAGCRSALVVDIGWRESTVTAVYEYRQVKQSRSTRAMRAVAVETARLLQSSVKSQGTGDMDPIDLDLADVEDLMSQSVWCRAIAKDGVEAAESGPSAPHGPDKTGLLFEEFARPVETLFSNGQHLDDQEHPLHILAYQCLLNLPPDIRAVCVSRIIITGGGSNVPGLKTRLLQMIARAIDERGWTPVFPTKKFVGPTKTGMHSKNSGDIRGTKSGNTPQVASGVKSETELDGVNKAHDSNGAAPKAQVLPASGISAHTAPQEGSEWEAANGLKESPTRHITGTVRGIETLGAWAGASLLANLKVHGVVAIDRDIFLQSRLAGARKEKTETNKQPAKAGEKSSWTLGPWS